MNVIHQLCFSHGLHLAVVEVMYNQVLAIDVEQDFEIEPEEEKDVDYDELCALNDIPPCELSEFNDNIYEYSCEVNNICITESFNLKSVVEKVRKIVKIFRKSPTKMDDIFRARAIEVFGKECTLNIDTKTRWNSTYIMLQRFCDAQKCINLSLTDLNETTKSDLVVSSSERQLIATVCQTLKPILKATEILCQRDTTLLKADTVLSSLLKSIPVGSPFPDELSKVLVRRINERRGEASIALQYLHNRGSHSLHPDLLSVKSIKRSSLEEVLLNIFTRSQNVENVDNEVEILPFIEEDTEIICGTDFEEIYNQESIAMERQGNIAQPKTTGRLTGLKSEMLAFDNTGIKGKILKYCYTSLLSVPATSVEPERNFSAAGNIVTKLRTKLSDESIKDILMLKSFFKNKKQQ